MNNIQPLELRIARSVREKDWKRLQVQIDLLRDLPPQKQIKRIARAQGLLAIHQRQILADWLNGKIKRNDVQSIQTGDNS